LRWRYDLRKLVKTTICWRRGTDFPYIWNLDPLKRRNNLRLHKSPHQDQTIMAQGDYNPKKKKKLKLQQQPMHHFYLITIFARRRPSLSMLLVFGFLFILSCLLLFLWIIVSLSRRAFILL